MPVPWRMLFAVLLGVLLAAGWFSAARRASRPSAADPHRLSEKFLQASLALRRHQDAEGAWLTYSTPLPVFRDPMTPHTNVFVPALIIDMLDPVAAETGLGDVLERARRFLRAQIEDTGLVRYFGKRGFPGQPHMPSQPGCETPPDLDDTSLIWRIAPPDDPSLVSSVLRAVELQRTGDGLYGTWLSNPDVYRCFHEKYRGRDVNPADAGVLMHLYLFLARHDAEAARKLCEALQARIDDERIWVWYTVAPLMPIVREADLARAGCPIRVPPERLRHAPPGQELYLELGLDLRDILLDQEPPPIGQSIEILRRLAEDGFAELCKNPPAIYNNDPTWPPSESGTYWSQDLAYALWLRTYVEAARRSPGSLTLPSPPRGTS